ncbi:DEAD/DEAH box helicase [Laspinema sp. D1]|uniref:DEAD/DEAH box helicase n=1 Tax=Laspinema palackyanum D2a TaxID=2953684 RepID=A0ABT2MW51_9CYAN|nr:DEAD/DEAH box helicase [Laspinema sp. D2a]
MPNPNPNQRGLIKKKTIWKNLPTTALRVPEVFAEQLKEIAQSLDNGQPVALNSPALSVETVTAWMQGLDVETLLELKQLAEIYLIQAKERQCDRRLEQALCFLAARCDGAYEEDGQGFNKPDSRFGKWLAHQIEEKQPILKAQAHGAWKMLQKYRGQLERGGLTLPNWEAIESQYPNTPPAVQSDEDELPEKRVTVVGNRIAVYAPYDPTGRFQQLTKSIEGYKFDGTDKSWKFPLDKIEIILEKFPASDYWHDLALAGLVEMVQAQKAEKIAKLKEQQEQAEKKSSEIINLIKAADLDSPLPCGWYLRDYQKKGVEWLLAHQRKGVYNGGILADDMGLGKTITALVAAKAIQQTANCPVFVVAPVSLLENWQREAEKVGIPIECWSWAKMPLPLENQEYLLIADEAHFAQNSTSKRTQNLLDLAQNKNCIAAWLLTGTPLKNGRPINLFPLLVATNHPLGQDKWAYHRRYCDAYHRVINSRGKTVWDVTGAAHLDELAKKTEDVILRRKKQECLKELPAKTRLFKQTELEPKQSKAYQAEITRLVKEYRQRAKSGEVDPDAEALVTLNYLRKVGSEFKVEAAIALAEEILEQGQQIVIFTEFVESAKTIHAHLGGELLTGEIRPDERQGMIDRFQSGESKVFTGTIKAGGVGITLTAASHIILVDRPWTPGDAEQAEDRCHRLGQQNAVFATWLQLGQIDQAIDSLLQEKQQRIELVLKGKRKTLKGLDSPKELARQLMEIL